jgi:hypothetical protein
MEKSIKNLVLGCKSHFRDCTQKSGTRLQLNNIVTKWEKYLPQNDLYRLVIVSSLSLHFIFKIAYNVIFFLSAELGNRKMQAIWLTALEVSDGTLMREMTQRVGVARVVVMEGNCVVFSNM